MSLASSWNHPALLALGPAAVVALLLLERLRRRPLEVVVADLTLFEPTPEAEREARAARRRTSLRFILLALAALLLSAAAASPRGPAPPAGALVVDVVLDRGPSSGAAGPGGVTALDRRRAHLDAALALLRPDDRVRVHLVPGEPATTGLAPDVARAVLAAARPAAGAAELEPVLARLARAPAATAGSAPPVLVAAATPPVLEPASAAGRVAVALARVAVPDRGIVSLEREPGGDVHVVVAAHDAPGEARVQLVAHRRAPATEVTATRALDLPARGLARATWTVADGAPPDASSIEARLVDPTGAPWRDALALDDRAFGAPGVPRRRVALVGTQRLRGEAVAVWAAVRRALGAVPGTTIVDVTERDLAGSESLRAGLDLVVLDQAPAFPPRGVAFAGVVLDLPPGARPGRVAGQAHLDGAAFAHTLDELVRSPLEAPGAPKATDGYADLEPLLVAGPATGGGPPLPVLLVRGRGRDLALIFAAPPGLAWTRHESWPLLWAEALELAAPSGEGRFASVSAGSHVRGLPRAPLDASLVLDADGAPILGTVAAPIPDLDLPAIDQPFAAVDLGRLDASRPQGERAPLGPWLALLALALVLGAWSTGR